MEKQRKHRRSMLSLTLTLLVLIWVSGSSVLAEPDIQEETDNNGAKQQRLETVTSTLEELEAERQKLMERKESLQMKLWGSVPEEEEEEDDEGFFSFSESDDVFEMSIVELMGVDVLPVGTLTQTTRRTSPGAITTITNEQLWESGAHSLYEALEIYVPGLQYSIQSWEAPTIGIRGIGGDRNDKLLMLVNGRVMNERTHFGALSELDLPMFGDIHHIDVIRGPGSAIYGPGAVSGVVNIVTENGLTFKGMEIITKLGAIEEFGSFEFKYGRKFAKDAGAYFYFGIDKYKGADQDDAPYVMGRSFSSFGDNYGVEKGDPVPFHVPNDNQAWDESPRMKFHAQLTVDDFDFWARYTRGGQDYVNPSQAAIGPDWWGWTWGPEWWQPAGEQSPSGTGYEQFTVFAKHTKDYTDTFNMEYVLSYDKFRYMRRDFSNSFNKHDEDEFFARALARLTPNEAHSMAIGAEVSLESFNSMTDSNFNAWQISGQRWDNEAWTTATISAMAEWQYNISDQWKTFMGGRIDKNTYTEELGSPRGAIVYTPTEEDTFKFMYTKSVRMANAEESRLRWLNTKEESKPEELENFELRWERQYDENLWFAISGYTSELDVIAWNGSAAANVGIQKTWGLEGEVVYEKDNWKLSASHNYTQLKGFKDEPGSSTVLYSGNELANWSDHQTKVQAKYDITPKFSVNSSARIYWGFPGGRRRSKVGGSIPENSFSEAWDTSIFFNLGLGYQFKENLSVRLDGTNLLGFFDYEYNRRPRLFDQFNDYRSTAPSVIFSLNYKF